MLENQRTKTEKRCLNLPGRNSVVFNSWDVFKWHPENYIPYEERASFMSKVDEALQYHRKLNFYSKQTIDLVQDCFRELTELTQKGNNPKEEAIMGLYFYACVAEILNQRREVLPEINKAANYYLGNIPFLDDLNRVS